MGLSKTQTAMLVVGAMVMLAMYLQPENALTVLSIGTGTILTIYGVKAYVRKRR